MIGARPVGAQAATAGPRAQTLDALGSGHCHRYDVLRRLQKRHVQQGCQAATGSDLGPSPIGVVRPALAGIELKLPQIQLPDCLSLLGRRQVQKEDPIEPLGSAEFRRQTGDIVARANDVDVRCVVIVG